MTHAILDAESVTLRTASGTEPMKPCEDSPKKVGRYEIEEFLKEGGTACVYRARDPVIGRTVGIKILKPAVCGHDEAEIRFRQEAQLAARVEHDNIVRVYDFDEEDGRPYMVMEL